MRSDFQVNLFNTFFLFVNQPICSFKNPLSMELNECTYKVEGPGLQTAKIVNYRNVQSNEEVTIKEKFTPKRQGERKIICNFNCKEIQGISGSKTVTIQ